MCLLSVFVCFDSNHFTLSSLLVRACFVFMRLCECEYLFLNLMHFAVTCKNVCVRVQVSMKVTVNEYVCMCDLTVLTFLRFFFIYTLDVAEN